MKMRVMLSLVLVLILSFATSAQAQIVIDVGMAETAEQAGLDYLENVLIPKFEAENPGIKVEMSIIGWGIDNFLTRYIADVAPDVFQIGGDRLGTYADMIISLEPYIRGWDELSDFPPVLLEGGQLQGEQYAIPWVMAIRSLYYRTDWFEEAGLNSEQPPTTWEELIDAGRALAKFAPDGRMIRQGYSASNHWLEFATWLYQAGGAYMTPDRSAFTFGEEAGLEAADFMRSMVTEYQIADPSRSLGDLEEHESAMEVAQPGVLSEPDFRDIVGVAMPTRKHVQVGVAYADHWVINNHSPNPDAAWKWIEFMSRIDNLLPYSIAAKILPPRMSSVNYEPWSTDPRFMTVYQSTVLSEGLPFDSPAIDRVRRDYIQPTLQRIMYENAPLTELVEAQRQANAYLAANY